MGLGAAMAGGNPEDGREEDDFYPTPWEVTEALLRKYKFGDRVIHECCAGDGAMVEVIQRHGYEVVASDIVQRGASNVIIQDFLTLKQPMAKVVVTNPPFKLAAQMIEHGMGELGLDCMCLVLKSTFFHARNRHGLFQRHKPKVVAPLLWRPDFLQKGRPTMDCSWFIWVRGNTNDPIYRPLKKPDASRLAVAIT